MKKFAFFATALMVLASCSNTDELMGTGTSGTQSAKQAITFESPFVNKNTRASGEIDNNTIKKLTPKVWGFYYTSPNDVKSIAIGAQDDGRVLGEDLYYSDEAWTYEHTTYWNATETYDFLSVVDGFGVNSEPFVINDNSDLVLRINSIPFVQKYSNVSAGEVDSDSPRDIVIASDISHSGADAGTVTLNYKHLLSRLDVYAYSQENKASIKLTSLKLYLPSSKFKYDYKVNILKNVTENGSWVNMTSTDFTKDLSAASSSELEEKGYEAYELITEPMTVLAAASAQNVVQEESKYLCPAGFWIAPIDAELNEAVYLEAAYQKNNSQETVKVPLTKINLSYPFDSNRYIKLILRINGEGVEPITFKTNVAEMNPSTNSEIDVVK